MAPPFPRPMLVVPVNEVDDFKGASVKTKEPFWTQDQLATIKSLLPLISTVDGKMSVKYNFTHLSSVLGIPKKQIYIKLIELHHQKQDTLGTEVAIPKLNHLKDNSLSPNTSIPFVQRHVALEPTLSEEENVSDDDDDDDTHSGVNLNMASGFLYRNKFGIKDNAIADDDDSDDLEDSLESLLLEEEVLKRI